MRINRIDITGFKSFMDRTVLGFDDGITGVVGPNGCGKSNVVDAIRWVMGEQSAKNLRGRGMEDVIFNGSETHAPLSMAEVTLTMQVGAGDTLPPALAGLPEVSVTRRLFRNGDSEYQLNRTTCRLLDITELFLGTGVGTRAYSIIEQGRVGQIVSARPEDRRAFIEEAAGVTRYKARRKAAERKLEYTQQNLLRVNDIVVELEKRLDSLDRQARKAEKYKRLKGEMREIELHALAHRHLELAAQRKVLELQLSSLSGEEREAFERVRSMEESVAARRAALEADSAGLEALAAEAYAVEAQVQLDAQNLAHWQEDLAATRSRTQAAQAELMQVAGRRAEVELARAEATAELERLGVASREDEVQLRVQGEELRRTTELLDDVGARLERERRELVDAEKRVANHETNLTNLEARRAELEERVARLSGELSALRAEEAQLESARREVLSRVEQSRAAHGELLSRRGEEEASLTRLREAFAENEVGVIALREELADKRSRLQALEEISRSYEGFDRGVRAVMAKAGSEPRQVGVFGLVSDVLAVPAEYEKAVEGALGDRLQHVIVETPERGFQLIEYLKGLSEGRSTFLPVPAEPQPPLPPLDSPDVRAMALSQVQVRDEVLQPLVEQLLSGVAVVADLIVARSLSVQHPTYSFVTLDGDVVRPGGATTGGVLEGPAVGALQKKRQIAELDAEVKRVEERYNELITRHYELQKQLGHSEGVLKGLEKHRHAEELSLTTHEKDLHQAGSSLSKLRDRSAALEGDKAQLGQQGAALAHELEGCRGEVVHGQAEKQTREDRVRLLASEIESLKARGEALAAETTALKVKVASSSERGEAVRRRSDELAQQHEELAARAGRLEATRVEGVQRVGELETRVESTAAERSLRVEKHAELAGHVEQRKAAYAQALAQVHADEVALKEARAKADALQQGLSAASMKERELSLELQHVERQTVERYQVEIHEAIHQFHTHPPLGPEAEQKLKELRAQVERMGEVNVTAIEEHKELRERFEFLSRQKKDLEDSLAQLDDAIKKIDATSRQRFRETFDVVNEKFQQVFPRLFGGGRASLMLTQELPGQEAGVEILAQPPGKKLQSVSLFSGGEKALTAVALIFAIFLIKPTPFCLLDEVDAPLDEGNVGRYNEMVREMSKQSQFILITHNKKTMEVVDTLYGVTMEEPGVSKLVSVKMREAVAANSDTQVA